MKHHIYLLILTNIVFMSILTLLKNFSLKSCKEPAEDSTYIFFNVTL